jgi:biotin carboxyl carrier protein
MKQFQIKINDTSYEVEILDDPRQEEVQVRVNGEEFTVKTDLVVGQAPVVAAPAQSAPVAAPTARPATRSIAPAQPVAAVGPGTVKSPLPGLINSIKVTTGDTVKANQEICVIEAMKAMNVIRAPQAGTIGRIYVSEGSQVAHGAPLMDIE